MKAYQAKTLPVPEFESGNFYSDNPYEVEAFMAKAKYQQAQAYEAGNSELFFLWMDEGKQARKWLRTHFTTA